VSSILLANAGTSIWDEEHRIQGSRSLPLSPRGREEVQRLASQLDSMPFRVVYTGHSSHCLETARILAQGRRARVRRLGALGEVDHGLWEGLCLDELDRQYRRAYRTWLHNPSAVRPPQGETIAHAYQRVCAALARLTRRHPRELIVIIAPRVLRALIQCCLRGLGPQAVWQVYREDSDWELLTVPKELLARA